MEKNFKQHDKTSRVIYAESLNRNLQKKVFEDIYKKESVLFITTQPFYELYYEKLTSKFGDNKFFNWYICPNKTEVYHLEMYQNLILYIESMGLKEGTLIFCAGDYPIYHLCGSLRASCLLIDELIYIPTTVSGLVESLIGESYLLNGPLSYGTKFYALPERIVYDTMLNELEPISAWNDSFYILVKLGILYRPELLKDLYNASVAQRHEVFTPFLETIIELIQNTPSISSQFGMAFGKSFYRVKEAHYLNYAQKKYIGFLLHLLWCIEKNKINFNFSHFFAWFEQILGLELSIPIQMTSYDLAESIVFELSRYQKIDDLVDLGRLRKVECPTVKEIDEIIDKYRLINKE